MKKVINTPRRKRLNKVKRLNAASAWIRDFKGNDIISSYAKWFGIDKLAAIKELRLKGISINENRENQIIASLKTRNEQRKRQSLQRMSKVIDEFSVSEYYFIGGYTSNGVPYGIKHEDMKSTEAEE